MSTDINAKVLIIIIISSSAMSGPRPPQANVASNLYPVQLPASFYNPVSLRLHLPCQSILILVSHILVDLQAGAYLGLGRLGSCLGR